MLPETGTTCYLSVNRDVRGAVRSGSISMTSAATHDWVATYVVQGRTTKSNNTTTTKEQPTNMQLYEYAVIYVPLDDTGNEIKADCKVLTSPTTMLAKSDQAVQRKAIRDVTDDGTLDMDFVQVIVRPFGRY